MPPEIDEQDQGFSLRADLESAFAENTEAPNDAEQEASPEPAPAGRDASGKFAPRTPAQPLPEDPEQKLEEAPAPAEVKAEAAPADRAPVSWKPLAREKWATLDPELKAEVMRRESEISTALSRTAHQRQIADQVEQVVAPYMPMIQAEGGDPVRTISNLLNTAAQLRTAPAAQKAQLVADMISHFGVDIEALDQALTGRVGQSASAPQPSQDIARLIQQQLAPVQQFMQSFQGRQQQEVQQSLQQFMADPANEFANDVREDMADLLEMAAKRGQTLSLQDAYKRATLAHPQIADIVTQRQLQQAASQQTAASRRAKKASASLPSSGAPSTGSDEDEDDDGSIRSALTAAMRTASRQ